MSSIPVKPVRVGILVPSFLVGYVENWFLQLARYTDSTRIKWSGMALLEWSQEDPRIVSQIAKIMPVYGTPVPPAPEALHDYENVQRYGDSAAHGIMQVAMASDVLLCWGFTSTVLDITTSLYRQRGMKVVVVSQSPEAPENDDKFGLNADMCVASCKEMLPAFTEKARTKARILYNGIDVGATCPTMSYKEVHDAWGLPQTGTPIVGIIGNLGGNDPVQVAKALRKINRDFRFVVFTANEDERRQLEGPVKKIYKDAVFPEKTLSIGNTLVGLSCLVHNGDQPVGMVNSVPNAWFAGVPVVSTSVGIWPELQAEHGLLVEPLKFGLRGVAMLATSIQKVSQGQYRAYNVNLARNIAWQYLSATYAAERWTELFEEICRQ